VVTQAIEISLAILSSRSPRTPNESYLAGTWQTTPCRSHYCCSATRFRISVTAVLLGHRWGHVPLVLRPKRNFAGSNTSRFACGSKRLPPGRVTFRLPQNLLPIFWRKRTTSPASIRGDQGLLRPWTAFGCACSLRPRNAVWPHNGPDRACERAEVVIASVMQLLFRSFRVIFGRGESIANARSFFICRSGCVSCNRLRV